MILFQLLLDMKPHDSTNDLAKKITVTGKKKRSKVIIILVAMLLLGAASITVVTNYVVRSNSGQEFVTEPVRRGDIGLTITATGNLEPTNQVSVGSELSGTVLEARVDSNDIVKAGQIVARLDTTKLEQQTESLRASLLVAKAMVNQAEATVAESGSSLERLEELHRISGGRTPSQADLDTATASRDRALADLESAKASVSQAEAQVKANESDLGKALIKSPIDGIVLSRSIEPGQTVASQFEAPELFVVAESLTRMKLNVAVAEADIGRVEPGQVATFTVDAWPGRKFSASVVKVSYASVITDNVVTYETELEVANDDLSLRPGMTATADIRVAEANGVLLVSTSALRFKPVELGSAPEAPKKSFVQSLTPGPPRRGPRDQSKQVASTSSEGPREVWVLRDGHPEPLKVTVGLTDGRSTEISGPGVSDGLKVVIRATTSKS